jgi:hypothetical protein
MASDPARIAARLTRVVSLAAFLLLPLAMAAPALAQGRNVGHGKRPSQTRLPPPTAIGQSSASVPFAWMDDATLMPPGSVWMGVSTMRWFGGGASELYFPVVDFALGLMPRVQITGSVPRIAGTGLGTTYFTAKIGAWHTRDEREKLAIAPTIEVANAGAVALTPDHGRVQWGLPVSVEIDRGAGRVYASGGYFSHGVLYAGAGGGFQATPQLGVSTSFSRSWTTAAPADSALPPQTRSEISGGVSYMFKPSIGAFASIGHTIATDESNGAGMTMSVGMSVSVSPAPPAREK